VKRRWVKVSLAAVAATALAAPLAGCGGGDEPPNGEAEEVASPEERTAAGETPIRSELVGIWLVDEIDFEGRLLVSFNRNGTFAIDDRGLLDTTPAAAGNYRLDGKLIMFESSGSDICTEGDTWAFEAGVPDEGRLTTVVREDAADECSLGVGTEWRWIRVSPSSPPGNELRGERGEDAVPPEDEETLAGIWLLEGSGVLLRIGEDRSYALDDAGRLGVQPLDVGSFRLDRQGALTFTSGRRSEACAEGDRWVWERVQITVAPAKRPDPDAGEGGLAVGGDWTLDADVAEDECGHAAGDDARWLRISW
jgi:hypothetical protein